MHCNDNAPVRYIPPFAGFTQFTASIPKLYWDVKSQEQRIKAICEQLHKVICYADMIGDKENKTIAELKELVSQFEQFKESGFLDYYEKQLEAWINANMPEIIGKYVGMVFFGLTMGGHFVAYIPEGSNWDDIGFDTGAVYGLPDYGRLKLIYNVDGESDVDQSFIDYDEASFSELAGQVNTLWGQVMTPIAEP